MELLLVLIVVFGVFLLSKHSSSGGRSRYKRAAKPTEKSPKNNWGMANPENQIAAIKKVNFEKSRLMNASEARVFRALEKIVADVDIDSRVMAQTCLGEFISTRKSSGDWKARKDAFASINSKRIDFVVVDQFGLVSLAVEYQGSGHHGTNAYMRDAVKKEALRRAGIPLVEVSKGMKPSELEASVKRILAEN